MTDLFKPIYTDFKGWKKSEWLWLIAALFFVWMGSIKASPLELIAALTNVLCVILVAKGRISNYYWGLIGVVLYAIVSYNQQYYGNMSLNIIYIAFQFWGVYEWRKEISTIENQYKGAKVVTVTMKQDVSVKRLTLFQLFEVTGMVVFGTCLSAGVLYHFDDPAPILDGFTLVASLIAMTLMVKQYSEQWVLWILVNIVSIYMWVIPALHQPGSWAMVAMWTVFLINSLYGAYKWFFVKENK